MVTRRLTGEQMAVMEVKGQRHLLLRRPGQRDQPGLAAAARSSTSRRATCCARTAALRTGTTFTGLRGASPGQRAVHHDRRGHGPGGDHVGRARPWCCGSRPQYPLPVDPGAYVAHQGNLRQNFQSGVNFRTLIGEGWRRVLPDPLRGRRAGVRPAERAQHDRGRCLMAVPGDQLQDGRGAGAARPADVQPARRDARLPGRGQLHPEHRRAARAV